MRIRAIIALAAAVGLSACAEYGGYRPVVDTSNDPNAQNLTRDEGDCREVARQASGGSATQTAIGGAGLIGAAGGAAIGAATGGNAGRGAAIGGAAGGVGGGAYKGIKADADYKSAYRTCMQNRGHNVIN